MQFKLFVIPISNCEQAVAEMNAFLRGHKIIAVTKEFVATGENSFYSIIAEYIDTSFAPAADKGKASVDYKSVFTFTQKRYFAALGIFCALGMQRSRSCKVIINKAFYRRSRPAVWFDSG